MFIVTWLTGKAAVPLLAAACALLLVVCGNLYVTAYGFPIFGSGGLTGQVKRLEATINDPPNGYVHVLARCVVNSETASANVDTLGKQITDLATATTNNNAALTKAMGDLRAANVGARTAAARVLNLPRPAPEDACLVSGRVLKGGAP